MFHRDDPFNRDGQLQADALRSAQQAAAAGSVPSLHDCHGYASPLGQIIAPIGGGGMSGARVILNSFWEPHWFNNLGTGATDVVAKWALSSELVEGGFETGGFDTGGFYSTSFTDRLTVPQTGYYLVGVQINWSNDDESVTPVQGPYDFLEIARVPSSAGTESNQLGSANYPVAETTVFLFGEIDFPSFGYIALSGFAAASAGDCFRVLVHPVSYVVSHLHTGLDPYEGLPIGTISTSFWCARLF